MRPVVPVPAPDWEEYVDEQNGNTDQQTSTSSPPGGGGQETEDDSDDREPDDPSKYVCRVCEYRTEIDTTAIKTDHWCRGECDEFQWFIREDKYEPA